MATDMGKGFNGLYGLVRERLECNPTMHANGFWRRSERATGDRSIYPQSIGQANRLPR